MSDFGFRYHIGRGDVGGTLIYYDNTTGTTAKGDYEFTNVDGSTKLSQALFEIFDFLFRSIGSITTHNEAILFPIRFN